MKLVAVQTFRESGFQSLKASVTVRSWERTGSLTWGSTICSAMSSSCGECLTRLGSRRERILTWMDTTRACSTGERLEVWHRQLWPWRKVHYGMNLYIQKHLNVPERAPGMRVAQRLTNHPWLQAFIWSDSDTNENTDRSRNTGRTCTYNLTRSLGSWILWKTNEKRSQIL